MYPSRIPVLLTAVPVLLAEYAGGTDVALTTNADDIDTPTDGGGSADIDASSDGNDLELSNPERLLRDAGGFTVSQLYTDIEAATTREFVINPDTERSYSYATPTTDGRPDAGGVEQYVTDGMTYVHVGGGGEATYTSYEGSTRVLVTAIALLQARAYGADDNLTFAGIETFDGTSVKRYELSIVNEALVLAGSAAAQGEPGALGVMSFEYVILVGEDGLSCYRLWSFSGRMGDGSGVSRSWEHSLAGADSMIVGEPARLDEARAQGIDSESGSWFPMRPPGFEPHSPAHSVHAARGDRDGSLFSRVRTTLE